MTRYEGASSRRSTLVPGAGKAGRELERLVDKPIQLGTGRGGFHDAREPIDEAMASFKRVIKRQDYWEARSLSPVEK